MATVRLPASRCKASAQRPLLLLLALVGCLALASAAVDAGDGTNAHRKLMQAQRSPAQAHTCPALDGYTVTVNGHTRWDQEYRCEGVGSASALIPACTPNSICKGFIVRTEASGALTGCLLNNAVPDAIGFWYRPTCLYAKQAK